MGSKHLYHCPAKATGIRRTSSRDSSTIDTNRPPGSYNCSQITEPHCAYRDSPHGVEPQGNPYREDNHIASLHIRPGSEIKDGLQTQNILVLAQLETARTTTA